MSIRHRLFGPPDVQGLKEAGDVSGLIKALSYEPDRAVRCQAAVCLGDLHARLAIEDLIERLGSDDDPDVRRAAAIALGQMRARQAFLPLITALHDVHEGVRGAAASALGKLGNKKAIPFLLACLKTPPHEIQETAAGSLRQLGWQPDVTEDAAYYYIISRQWSACARLGKISLKPLLLGLIDPQYSRQQGRIIWTLGQIGDPAAIPSLLDMLRSDRSDIRRAVVEALGEIGTGDVISPLLFALKDSQQEVQWAANQALQAMDLDEVAGDIAAGLLDADPAVRLAVVRLLSRSQSAETSAWLNKALFDEDRQVRLQVVAAVARHGDMGALSQALDDSDPGVRAAATRALGQIDDPHVLRVIGKVIDDEDKGVRRAAVEALTLFRSPLVIEPLTAVLDNRDPQLRSLAVQALGESGETAVVPALRRVYYDAGSETRQEILFAVSKLDAPGSLDFFQEALADADDQVRVTAVQLLYHFFPEEALSPLLDRVDDEAAPVREAVLRALASTESDEAFEALSNGRWDSDYRVSKAAIEGLANFGERALPQLQEALRDRRLSDQASIHSLEIIGLPAVPILLGALNHERLPARRSAADALLNLLAGELLPEESVQQIVDAHKLLTLYGDPKQIEILEKYGI
jgi:HEAT repeat protein